MSKKVLIIGSGGREYAIGHRLAIEGHDVVGVPGNPCFADFGKSFSDLKIGPLFGHLIDYVKREEFDLVVVGPEQPLDAGIVDAFVKAGLGAKIVGPTSTAAKIESSKIYAYDLFRNSKVPVPMAMPYPDLNTLAGAARVLPPPFVIKYDGLAAGKGVAVVNSRRDVRDVVKRFVSLQPGRYQIQDKVEGREMSVFVAVTGTRYRIIGSAADYKPLYHGGPNTGGMGGFAPHPLFTSQLLRFQIEQTIIQPILKGLVDARTPYTGIMYVQLMITKHGPVVIEVNCRFGDPEAQLIMPILGCDLFSLLEATNHNDLMQSLPVDVPIVQKSVGVTLAAKGYPDDPRKGDIIRGIEEARRIAHVFPAGVSKDVDGTLRTAGGRVLTVVGTGETYEEARAKAYAAVDLIGFAGKQYRDDIATEEDLAA